MEAKIALATVSGKAYYRLVKAVKAKGLPFLSLRPWDPIPLDVQVVVTTEKERPSVAHSNVLIFNEEDDPASVIGEAIRIAQGKRKFEVVTVGIDPGKRSGLAILGDGHLVRTINCSGLRETVKAVSSAIHEVPATHYLVKVGDGVPPYTQKLLQFLDESLPDEVGIQIVREAGTSNFPRETSHRRELKDAIAAIKIAGRNGKDLPRRPKAW